jgi:predicted methyltransferase
MLLVVLLSSGCAAMLSEEKLPESYYFWVVHSQERSDADRVTDQRRKPELLLVFYGLRPGMRVLDLGAGSGYNTELLARVVGPTGVVYAQNNRYFLDNFVRGNFDERLKKAAMRKVVLLVRDFGDPVPPGGRIRDGGRCILVLHDRGWVGAGGARMTGAV